MPRDGSTLIHRYVLWFVITAIDPAQWIKSLLYKLGDLSLYLWSPHKTGVASCISISKTSMVGWMIRELLGSHKLSSPDRQSWNKKRPCFI